MEDDIIAYAKIEDGQVVELLRVSTRPPAGYLPVYRIMPPSFDPELQELSGEWIYTVLADRVEQRPDWFFYPVEIVRERIQSRKIRQVRGIQMAMIQAVLPGIRDKEMAEVVLEIMRSVLPAALSLSAKMTRVRDTVQAANAAVSYLNSETDIQTLRAYDPRTAPAWPA